MSYGRYVIVKEISIWLQYSWKYLSCGNKWVMFALFFFTLEKGFQLRTSQLTLQSGSPQTNYMRWDWDLKRTLYPGRPRFTTGQSKAVAFRQNKCWTRAPLSAHFFHLYAVLWGSRSPLGNPGSALENYAPHAFAWYRFGVYDISHIPFPCNLGVSFVHWYHVKRLL